MVKRLRKTHKSQLSIGFNEYMYTQVYTRIMQTHYGIKIIS